MKAMMVLVGVLSCVLSGCSLADDRPMDFYNPECLGAHPPKGCEWSRATREAKERQMIAAMTEKFTKEGVSKLGEASWVWPGKDADKEHGAAKKKTEEYCQGIRAALMKGEYVLFPEPKASLTQVGRKAYAQTIVANLPANRTKRASSALQRLTDKVMSGGGKDMETEEIGCILIKSG